MLPRGSRAFAALVVLSAAWLFPVATAVAESPLDKARRFLVQQTLDVTCGAAALGTLLGLERGERYSEAQIVHEMLAGRSLADIRAQGGFSLLDLKMFLQRRGIASFGATGFDADELNHRAPLIAPVRLDAGLAHFVVVLALEDDAVLLADPASGLAKVPFERFRERWNGIAFDIGEPD